MTAQWTNKIDEVTADFMGAFGTLTAAQLNWKPNAGTWSIAQNLDHLMVINKTYYPILNALRQGNYKTPFTGKIGFLVNFLGNTLLKAVHPSRRKKMKTVPIWEPAKSVISADILSRFQAHQSDLKQQIILSENILHDNPVISSPANRYIVYRIKTAFDIIVTHEQRHFEQAKELRMLMN